MTTEAPAGSDEIVSWPISAGASGRFHDHAAIKAACASATTMSTPRATRRHDDVIQRRPADDAAEASELILGDEAPGPVVVLRGRCHWRPLRILQLL